MRAKKTVVVLGGGFAGLETVFYLRHKLGDRIKIRLIANDKNFVFKPDTIYIPFGADPKRFVVPLTRLVDYTKAELLFDRVRSIDCENQVVEARGERIHYDYLVVATGAAVRADEIPGLSEHATSLWTPGGMLKLRSAYERLVDEVAGGRRRKLLFLLPRNNRCSSPIYEMILMTDSWLRSKGSRERVEITLASYEDSLLQALGPRFDAVVREEFAERGIAVRAGQVVTGVEPDRCLFLDGDALAFDILVSFPPHLAREPFAALPSDDRGFVRVDADSRRVHGEERVFAVGDASDYPIKRAFLALLQADAAAEHVVASIRQREPELAFEVECARLLGAVAQATFVGQDAGQGTHRQPGPADYAGATAGERHDVGISPLWRVGTKASGLHLPWTCGAGEPFHTSVGGEAK